MIRQIFYLKRFIGQILMRPISPNKKNACVKGNPTLPKYTGET